MESSERMTSTLMMPAFSDAARSAPGHFFKLPRPQPCVFALVQRILRLEEHLVNALTLFFAKVELLRVHRLVDQQLDIGTRVMQPPRTNLVLDKCFHLVREVENKIG